MALVEILSSRAMFRASVVFPGIGRFLSRFRFSFFGWRSINSRKGCELFARDMTRRFEAVCDLPFPDGGASAPPENAIGGTCIEPQSGQALLDPDAFFPGERFVFRSRGCRLRTARRQDAFASRSGARLPARSGACRADDVATVSSGRLAGPQGAHFRLLNRHSGLPLRIAVLVYRKGPRSHSGTTRAERSPSRRRKCRR